MVAVLLTNLLANIILVLQKPIVMKTVVHGRHNMFRHDTFEVQSEGMMPGLKL